MSSRKRIRPTAIEKVEEDTRKLVGLSGAYAVLREEMQRTTARMRATVEQIDKADPGRQTALDNISLIEKPLGNRG